MEFLAFEAKKNEIIKGDRKTVIKSEKQLREMTIHL